MLIDPGRVFDQIRSWHANYSGQLCATKCEDREKCEGHRQGRYREQLSSLSHTYSGHKLIEKGMIVIGKTNLNVSLDDV
jgi:hypothetical protein